MNLVCTLLVEKNHRDLRTEVSGTSNFGLIHHQPNRTDKSVYRKKETRQKQGKVYIIRFHFVTCENGSPKAQEFNVNFYKYKADFKPMSSYKVLRQKLPDKNNTMFHLERLKSTLIALILFAELGLVEVA